MNGSIRLVAISVRRQSISQDLVLNVLLVSRCILIRFIFSKFSIVESMWISMDDGTLPYVRSSFGFMVETDVSINGGFAPIRLLGTHYLNSAALFAW